MGGNPLTQQVAAKALKKLEAKAETQGGGAHLLYAIYDDNGAMVAHTGLRRSSNRDILVPHVKRDLRVNVHFIQDLAQCPKSRIDWLKAVGAVRPEVPEEEGKGEQTASEGEP